MRWLVIYLLFFVPLVSSLKITEIELNPAGTDSGNEWIELYSKEKVDLEDYKIINNDEDEIILEGIFEGYFIYEFGKQFLDNSDEKLFLYEKDELLQETEIFEDNKNDENTWQLCDDWNFVAETKNKKNECEPEEKSEKIEEFEEEEENSNKEEIDEEKSEKEVTIEYNQISKQEEKKEIVELKPISLGTQNIKSENSENKNKILYYGLASFCVLLGLLFLLKRKNYKNEFEN